MRYFLTPLRIEEADPDLANLFGRWLAEEKWTELSTQLTYALESALWRHRRTWFVAGNYCFKLSVNARGDDYIRVFNRSESLTASDSAKERDHARTFSR